MKYMELNYGVTELEETIKKDIADIKSGKYDVIYAIDFIEVEKVYPRETLYLSR